VEVEVPNLVVVDHGAEGFWVQGLPSEGEVVVALSLHLPQHCKGKGRADRRTIGRYIDREGGKGKIVERERER
jgi:hypothetical protein